jgi:hypothetical protein
MKKFISVLSVALVLILVSPAFTSETTNAGPFGKYGNVKGVYDEFDDAYYLECKYSWKNVCERRYF